MSGHCADVGSGRQPSRVSPSPHPGQPRSSEEFTCRKEISGGKDPLPLHSACCTPLLRRRPLPSEIVSRRRRRGGWHLRSLCDVTPRLDAPDSTPNDPFKLPTVDARRFCSARLRLSAGVTVAVHEPWIPTLHGIMRRSGVARSLDATTVVCSSWRD